MTLHFIVFIFHSILRCFWIASSFLVLGMWSLMPVWLLSLGIIVYFFFIKIMWFCWWWFYPVVFWNFIKLCLFVFLFLYFFMDTWGHYYIWRLGIFWFILIRHFLVDVFFNFHFALFCFQKLLLGIWCNSWNVLSVNVIFSWFQLSDICPNFGEFYQYFLLIIPTYALQNHTYFRNCIFHIIIN